MNYRHAYHAGNFADVLKHAALTALLLHLRKKEAPFAVIDTHAGRGVYDLGSPEATKTCEAEEGIARLLGTDPPSGVLRPYAEIVKTFGPGRYPGSPLIAARLLRGHDRLMAIEKHPEEHAVLAAALKPMRQAPAILSDGYRELAKLVPPHERRGLVLIDPPYEDENEFAIAAQALIAAHRRFATGIFVLWYPVKDRTAVEAAIGELLNVGIPRLLRVELDIGLAADDADDAERLSAAGLLVVNPPFGFAAEMEIAGAYLADRLKRGAMARFRVETLAGER